ncbi:MAG: peptidase M23 [Paracoccaceae bacterium]
MNKILVSLQILSLIALPAFAASGPAELARKAMENLDQAHLSLGEASGANDRVRALSQAIRAFEQGLNALRDSLRRTALQEAALTREFEAESQSVSQLLGVLLSIDASTGPVSLLHPTGPLGAARSGMIVSEITPAIQAEADAIRRILEEVTQLRSLQLDAATTLKSGLTGLQNARTSLNQAISERTQLPKRYLADPANIQSLINSAETLDGFASGLVEIDYTQDAATGIRQFSDAQGTLSLPVSGQMLRKFNEFDAAGVSRPGLVIATRPQALVTAPWPATLRYSGPLLDYGNVIILEPDSGTLLVLAGLETVYGEAGQVLALDDALGLMGGSAPDPNGFIDNTSSAPGSEATETLYIELRLNGKPVDPAIWFKQTKE